MTCKPGLASNGSYSIAIGVLRSSWWVDHCLVYNNYVTILVEINNAWPPTRDPGRETGNQPPYAIGLAQSITKNQVIKLINRVNWAPDFQSLLQCLYPQLLRSAPSGRIFLIAKKLQIDIFPVLYSGPKISTGDQIKGLDVSYPTDPIWNLFWWF